MIYRTCGVLREKMRAALARREGNVELKSGVAILPGYAGQLKRDWNRNLATKKVLC